MKQLYFTLLLFVFGLNLNAQVAFPLISSLPQDLVKLNNGNYIISGQNTGIMDLGMTSTYISVLESRNASGELIDSFKTNRVEELRPIRLRSTGRIICAAFDTLLNDFRFVTFNEELGDMQLDKKLSPDPSLVVKIIEKAYLHRNKILISATCELNGGERENMLLTYHASTLDFESYRWSPSYYYGGAIIDDGSYSANLNKITKYDLDGNVVWEKSFSSQYDFRAIAENSQGLLVVSGTKGDDAVIAKLDSNGNQIIEKLIEREDPDADPDIAFYSLKIQEDGNIVAIGFDRSYNAWTTSWVNRPFYGLIYIFDQDLDELYSTRQYGSEIKDIYYTPEEISFIIQSGGFEWCCTGGFKIVPISQVSANTGLDRSDYNIYPNPVSDILFLNSENDVDLEIIDITGNRIVKKNQVTNINVSDIANGLYWLNIFDGKNYNTKKFVKN